jgi:chorismate mutase
MISKKLNTIRIKLDKVDDQLLKVLKKRTLLVDSVIELKKFKKDIVDKKRIKKILNRVKKKSIKNKINTEITRRIWVSMINAYINYEFIKFKKK